MKYCFGGETYIYETTNLRRPFFYTFRIPVDKLPGPVLRSLLPLHGPPVHPHFHYLHAG